MCYQSAYAEITELFVKEEYRRQGVASALMAYTEAYFMRRSIKSFQLLTGKTNTNAQSLYEKCGYIQSYEIQYRKRME